MSDDIVTRLRELGRYVNTEGGRWFEPITTEAADKIERLRADRDRWRKLAQGEHYAWSQCAYGCDCLVDIYERAVRGE